MSPEQRVILVQFLSGAMMTCSLAIALFFLRFWRKTADRLFLRFSAAFGLLAVERWVLIWFPVAYEASTYIYLLRLFAFSLIIWAVVEKNRETHAV